MRVLRCGSRVFVVLLRAVPGLVVAALLAGLTAPPAARAASLPASAYAYSLDIDGEFLDHPALIYLYPQRTALEPPQLLVLWTNVPAGVGAVGAWRGHKLALLNQTVYLRVGGTEGISHMKHTGGALRLNWARSIGGLRVGAQAGGHYRVETEADESLRYSGGSSYYYDIGGWDRNTRVVEAAAGLGWDRSGHGLDLTGTVSWENLDDASLTGEDYSGERDTVFYSFEGDERPLYGVRARLRLGAAGRTEWVLLGGWRGRTERWTSRATGAFFGAAVDSTDRRSGWRDEWKIGAALSRPAGVVDRAIVSAWFTSRRIPEYEVDPYGIYEYTIRQRSASAVVSIQESVRWGLVGHAGLGAVYRMSDVETKRASHPDYRETRREREEDLDASFQWGVDWTWRNFRLTGAASADLDLSYLWTCLDARLIF